MNDRAIKFKAEVKENIEFLNHFDCAKLREVAKEENLRTGTKQVMMVNIARKWANRDVPAVVTLTQV